MNLLTGLDWLTAIDEESLNRISLKPFILQPHHIRGLQYILVAIVVAIIFNMIFGKRIRKAAMEKKPAEGKPLEYEKIVVDENNARQGVRVQAEYNVMLETSRLANGKRGPHPESVWTVDVSMKGLAFRSPQQFPLSTDVTLRLMETPIAASPVISGAVVACRPWPPGHTGSPPKEWLTSLQLKNVSADSALVLHRIVNAGEREQLAEERKKNEPEAQSPEQIEILSEASPPEDSDKT